MNIGQNIIASLITATLSFNVLANPELSKDDLTALLSNTQRPVADNQRDQARQPVNVMRFSDLAVGDHVLDIFAGGGWYTELFSMAVGEKGKVYAQNDSVIWRFAEKRIVERTKENRLANVTRLDKVEVADIKAKDKSLDLVFTALNYHDFFFTHSIRDGKKSIVRENVVDHRAALANIKRMLKDDGSIIIIDHVGKEGSGYNAPNDTHRIDPNIVKYQLAEAGFELVEEAYFLRNEQDDLSASVFSKHIRGKTDRFIYKFKKLL